MTKDEFIQKYRAQQKHGNGLAALWILSYFGVLIATASFGKQIDDSPLPVQIVCGVAFAAFLVGQIPLAIWYHRRETRKFGLHCPACDKALTGPTAQIAIATGHCGHCGSKLFAETPE